jgi:hypothetical protein
MKGMVSDRTSGEAQLKQSDRDWTIVYATRLKNGPRTGKQRVVASSETVTLGSINRADVADVLLASVDDADALHSTRVVTAA